MNDATATHTADTGGFSRNPDFQSEPNSTGFSR